MIDWKIYAMAALGGALVGARVDYVAFKNFQSWQDAAKYNWGMASWRWFQGAVAGIVMASTAKQFLGN